MNEMFKQALTAKIMDSISEENDFDGDSFLEIAERVGVEDHVEDFAANLAKIIVKEIENFAFTFRLSGLEHPVYKQDMGEWNSVAGSRLEIEDLLKSGRKILPL